MSSSGQCVLCQCNNRSTDCNPVTGECLVSVPLAVKY